MTHPIHPLLVHFPIACWSLASFADLTSIQFGEKEIWWTAGVLHITGVSTAIVAMIAGLIELKKVDEESVAEKTANLHMFFVITCWSLYATTLFLRLEGKNLTAPNLFEVSLSLLGLLFLCIAGWFGGKLVYEHGVGINK